MAEEAAAVRLPGVLWHVTVTVHGQPQTTDRLQLGLQSVAFGHGIDLSARYSPDTVELRYWDEGSDCRVVVGHALSLWDEYRDEVDLPAWPVVGVEVLDRPSFRRRFPQGGDPELFAPGVHPFTPPSDTDSATG